MLDCIQLFCVLEVDIFFTFERVKILIIFLDFPARCRQQGLFEGVGKV